MRRHSDFIVRRGPAAVPERQPSLLRTIIHVFAFGMMYCIGVLALGVGYIAFGAVFALLNRTDT